jgi:uncharacterized protein YfaS (alpha-2-macroglobulin family)
MPQRLRHLLVILSTTTVAAFSLGGACNEAAVPGGGEVSEAAQGARPEGEGAVAAPEAAMDDDGVDDKGGRLEVALTEAAPESPPTTSLAVAAALLPEPEAAKVLARLPAIGAEAGDVVDFALREGTRPPPLKGETVLGVFPPPAAPDAAPPGVTDAAPGVLRFQPEGDVPLAPRIAITFATPMVPMTSHATLAATAVPAKVTPALEGSWRWVGTRTLFFEPVGRAPMATDFSVEVPAGVKDALGRPLANGARFGFRTPPPSLVSGTPQGDGIGLTPVIVAQFDQRVDPQAALAQVRVTAAGQVVKVRPLSAAETAKELSGWQGDRDREGRWVAFRPVEPLPKEARVEVTFPKGFASAEGPRRTERELTFGFRTYGPLRVKEVRCGWGDTCLPGMPLVAEFTNPLAEDAVAPSWVSVSPDLGGLEVTASWRGLTLSGATKGKTRYEVVFRKEIKDIHGQVLGADATHGWKVGPSSSLLTSELKPMTVLDPAARKRRLPVYVINMAELEVELRQVTPDDWPKWLAWQKSRWDEDADRGLPGRQVFAGRIPTGAPPEEMAEVGVDLAPALKGELGHVIAVIRPTGVENPWERDRMTAATWVQVTRIGLDAFHDGEDLVAWATALGDGAPLGDVEVTLRPQGTTGRTDGAGLARLAVPDRSERQLLVARRGEDVAFLPDGENAWQTEGAWVSGERHDEVRWMTFDDRHLYRPDETVSVKGALRRIEAGYKGDVALLPAGAVTRLRWRANDAMGNKLGEGDAAVSPLGTFHLALKLPKTPSLGGAQLELSAGASNHTHYFSIQEFRRPEFEVGATVSEGPHVVGGQATVSVLASYFAGGPLPNAEVGWRVSTSPAHFVPPNHDEFVFGTWIPWWSFEGGGRGWQTSVSTLEGRTDASGRHTVALGFKSVTAPRPVSVLAEATIEDVNRQTWSTTSNVLVHPSTRYVGLKPARWFVEAGRPIQVDAVVTDLDGRRQADVALEVTVERLAWRKVGRAWREVAEDRQRCDVRSGLAPVQCAWSPKEGGRHRVTARVRDAEGRLNETTLSIWVPGGKVPESRGLEQQSVTLIPSKREYAPGETAEILVQAPFPKASGVWFTVRDGVAEEHPLVVKDGTATIAIPIASWMVPNLGVTVHLNGEAERQGADGSAAGGLPRRPAFAKGTLSLAIPPVERQLAVEVTPASPKTEPGAETRVSVRVRDAEGAAVVGAEVAVVIVDEAVLALSGHVFPDPVGLFHGRRDEQLQAWHLREQVMLATLAELQAGAGVPPKTLLETMRVEGRGGASAKRAMMTGGGMAMPAPSAMAAAESAPDDGGGGGGEAAGPIAVRKNFDALALFLPEGRTDARGGLEVPVKLPDNLTRYRVVAVAFSGAKHFGKGEAGITARLPLMVRMSAPRFLNFGDRFELPVVLQNQTDAPLEVRLALRATNAAVTGGAGRLVSVPANDRVEVRLPMSAARPGTARLQVGAVSGAWSDAAEVKLPVWTPATTEAFATYGELDAGAVRQPVALPGEVEQGFGGLEVQTSSTQLQALTDAVVYLTTYPFECSEQLASRVMAIAALKDVLTAFKAEGLPSPEALLGQIGHDLKRLRGMQAADGGFAFWRRDQPSWPFLTAHVVHALLRAREKGFDVPADMTSRGLSYLKDIRKRMTEGWYTDEARRAIESYALYVRARAGQVDAKRAAAILAEEGGVEKADLEVVGWLYAVAQAGKDEATLEAIRKHLGNRVSETAGAAHFVTSWRDGAHLLLHSARRVDGLLLEGLIGDQPSSDLIPKLVRGLLGHRKQGRWGSTQENAWVLLGLDRYFNAYEKEVPNFKARAWLGQLFAGEHAFRGRTTERHQIDVPMRQLAQLGGAADLTLSKEGPGRMYWRVGMRYAPKSLKLAPSDHGFHVERVYEALDDPKDVTREADGRWIIRAGARVRVKLTMHTEARRHHVALVDPMPAGLEALNPELRGTQATPRGDAAEGRGRGWWGPWYEHQNLRDERAEAFTALLWEGVYEYAYFARATTPGAFIVPPPKAEEMYAPETFGRGASDVVEVRAAP